MNDNIKIIKGNIVGEKYKSGMEFSFELAIPMVNCDKYALLLEHDRLNEANIKSMFQLAEEGNAPYCVNIGVAPGIQEISNGEKYNRRINTYDLFNSEYADFVVYELIPHIEKEYEIKFYENPDMHYVSGGSSGAISAFVIAWFHTEYFHRVYISSPSFLAMGRGNEIPYLIRKYETKPLKIYQEYSENEPNEYFGASYPIDIEAKMAFEYAGYDFYCEYFPNEGHCSRYRDLKTAYKRNKWIWNDYHTKPIVPQRNSSRIDAFIDINSKWEKVNNFPEKIVSEIKLNEKYSTLVLSKDNQFCYSSNIDDETVYSYVVKEKMEFNNRNTHAILHTINGITPKGAIDMDVDVNDRLYVLTSIGIQCVRSFGLIDAILDLPKGKPLKICVTDSIVVMTDCGIYMRKLKSDYLEKNKRLCISYYD